MKIKLIFGVCLFLIAGLSSASVKNISVPTGYVKVARAYGIPPKIFFSIALVESRKSIHGTKVMPWPWTLNVEGKSYRYATRKEAWLALNSFVKDKRIVDIGLMQVNWRWHKKKLKTTWLAFDPFHNMRVSAQILKSCYDAKKTWWVCVGRYHSPGQKAAQKERAQQYRERVARQYRRVV